MWHLLLNYTLVYCYNQSCCLYLFQTPTANPKWSVAWWPNSQTTSVSPWMLSSLCSFMTWCPPTWRRKKKVVFFPLHPSIPFSLSVSEKLKYLWKKRHDEPHLSTSPVVKLFVCCWTHLGEKHEMKEAEYYFHTQWGGQGAQCRQHFNGFPIVRKKQISTLYASNHASFMTIKIVWRLCSVDSAAE